MRKGIKNRSRRARRRERLYSLAVDVLDISLGLVLVWGPMLMAAITGAVIALLGW